MKTRWLIEDEKATVELIPETVAEKSIIDALGNPTTALVKRNGTLQFIMDLPKQPAVKPKEVRASDEYREA